MVLPLADNSSLVANRVVRYIQDGAVCGVGENADKGFKGPHLKDLRPQIVRGLTVSEVYDPALHWLERNALSREEMDTLRLEIRVSNLRHEVFIRGLGDQTLSEIKSFAINLYDGKYWLNINNEFAVELARLLETHHAPDTVDETLENEDIDVMIPLTGEELYHVVHNIVINDIATRDYDPNTLRTSIIINGDRVCVENEEVVLLQ